jgi:hypothetical protein
MFTLNVAVQGFSYWRAVFCWINTVQDFLFGKHGTYGFLDFLDFGSLSGGILILINYTDCMLYVLSTVDNLFFMRNRRASKIWGVSATSSKKLIKAHNLHHLPTKQV